MSSHAHASSSNSNGSSPQQAGSSSTTPNAISLLPEDAEMLDLEEFDDYVSQVYAYLQVGASAVCVHVCASVSACMWVGVHVIQCK